MTERVQLRPVAEVDLPTLFEHQRDPLANRMAEFPARDWPAFIGHWRRVLDDAAIDKQTILCDGRVAGHIVGFEQDGLRLVGYWIGREHWGLGIATTALTQFLTLFERRPLHAYVAAQNLGSRRVLEKCGFVVSGARRGTPGLLDEGADELLFELSG